MSDKYPSDLLYTEDHEWARVEGKLATIGVTQFAVDQLGDVTQVDLPNGMRSGLRVVQEILEGIKDISFCRLTAHDVVRHRLVGKIVGAYDDYESREEARPSSTGRSSSTGPTSVVEGG